MHFRDDFENSNLCMQVSKVSEESSEEVDEKDTIPSGTFLINPNIHESEIRDGDLEDGNAARLIDLGGVAPEKKTSLYLIMLTLCLGGLQIAFSIQFVAGTNHLLALDFSTTLVGVIWLLPPICGVLLHPFFGFWSDNCGSPLGKRKPFIIGGGICLSLFLVSFAWTIEISLVFGKMVGSKRCLVSASEQTCTGTQILAVISLLGINVSAQAIQAGGRALIVDQCPSYLQTQANAWGSRLSNIASIFIYCASSLDLVHMAPFLGDTQLKSLSLLGSLTLLITLSTTCIGINEKKSRVGNTEINIPNTYPFFKQLQVVMSTLPVQISRIHYVQFFSWFSWYPFMVYVSKYVGSIGHQARQLKNSHSSTQNIGESSREGAVSLLALSLGALITSIALPIFLKKISTNTYLSTSSSRRRHSRPFIAYKSVWFISQVIYSLSIFGIILERSYIPMVITTGLVGFSFAVTQWIPFTLLNIAILDERGQTKNHIARVGTVLGLHNIFIAAPQILSSLACAVIFKLVQEEVGEDATCSISWIFAGCGMVSLVAAVMVLRIEDIER